MEVGLQESALLNRHWYCCRPESAGVPEVP